MRTSPGREVPQHEARVPGAVLRVRPMGGAPAVRPGRHQGPRDPLDRPSRSARRGRALGGRTLHDDSLPTADRVAGQQRVSKCSIRPGHRCQHVQLPTARGTDPRQAQPRPPAVPAKGRSEGTRRGPLGDTSPQVSAPDPAVSVPPAAVPAQGVGPRRSPSPRRNGGPPSSPGGPPRFPRGNGQ